MAKKKKQDFNALIMNVAKAGGGGILAEIGTDMIVEKSPELIQNNPKMAEIIPIAMGTAVLYLAPPEWAPAGYGMIGAGASGFADDIMSGMQGFQRVNYMNGQISDEMSQGISFIENLEGIAFENVEIESDEDDGMI